MVASAAGASIATDGVTPVGLKLLVRRFEGVLVDVVGEAPCEVDLVNSGLDVLGVRLVVVVVVNHS